MTEEFLFNTIRAELDASRKAKYTGEKTFTLTFNSGGLTKGRITSDQVIIQPQTPAPIRDFRSP